jgi:hypothetical protein
LSQSPSNAVGQVSADGRFRWDGEQWVPIAAGTREPTSWTRPMQLAAAAIFTVMAVTSLVSVFIFFNHDTFVRVLKAQGTTIPRGTTIEEMANFAVGIAIATVVFFVVLELVVAVGSFLGWRWIFWAALVLFGFDAIGALTNLGNFAKPDVSPIPVGWLVLSELLSLAGLAMFVWMLVGVIKFGPWAMKKPGN